MGQEEKGDKRLREKRRRQQALWDVYNHRCVYTGTPIARAEDAEIDHVLPRWLVNDDSERIRLLEEFGLPPDFEIEGHLLNLVPTTKVFNNAKNGKTGKTELVANRTRQYLRYQPYNDRENAWKKPADELIRHGLALAAMSRAEVERRERELEIIELLEDAIDLSPRERQRNLPELMDERTGGAAPFPRRFDRWTNTATAQGGAAYLNFFLPTESAPSGSAVLLFKSLRIRDAMIDFRCRELLSGLFRGFGGFPDDERPFVVGPADDGYFVQVQHVRFWLSKNEVRDLCSAIDAAAPEYLHASEAVERKWRSLHLRQAERGYRLCEVSLPVWVGIIYYASGETGLNERQAIHRVIPVRDGPDGQNGPIAAWLRAEPAHSTHRVFVCWDPLEGAEMLRANGSDAWHAEQIQAWLDERALPSLLEPARRRVSWLESLIRRDSTQRSPAGARVLRDLSHVYEWKQRNLST